MIPIVRRAHGARRDTSAHRKVALLGLADNALLVAKRAGRDRVVCDGEAAAGMGGDLTLIPDRW